MGGVTLLAGLLLPWLAGMTALVLLRGRRPFSAPGEIAWIAGAGYLVGAFVLTLWMRLLSTAGVGFGALSIGAPLLAATAIAGYFAWRRAGAELREAVRAAARAAISPPGLEGITLLAWRVLLAWTGLRFLLLGAAVAWQPLYPWDAWTQWATKARVWFELGRIVPFTSADAWFAADGGAYFDAAPGNPPTMPLLQVWACIALGRWDDALMNWPWWQIAVALAAAVYGAMRAHELPPLAALVVAFFVASLPLANAHVALAGYADLPLAAYYTCAVLALLRWIATRDLRDAALAVLLAWACTQITNAGFAWAATLVPGAIVALMPARGLKTASGGTGRNPLPARGARPDEPDLPRIPAAPRFRSGLVRARRKLFSARLLEPPVVRCVGRDPVELARARVAIARSADHGRRGRRDPAVRLRRLSRHPHPGRRADDPQSRHAALRAAAGRLRSAGVSRVRAALGGHPAGNRRQRHLNGYALRIAMLELPDVTLCCIDTRNHALAMRALARSRDGVRFARALLLTDALPAGTAAPEGIDVVSGVDIASREAYSEFVLKSLLPHVATAYVLLVQWDGYVINPAAWDPAFLACDYIGAKWFWHEDRMRVGNGGFSLRSRRLLEALLDPRIVLDDAEDTTICRTFRPLLEREHGIRFADEALADRFSFEASYPIGRPFGFHGLFNFCRTVAPDEIAALAPQFSNAIARSPQLLQLMRNCSALGQWNAAIAIATRILAAVPGHAEAATLQAACLRQAQAPPAAGRNDPCPCGSGKRYKQCHGALGASAAPAAAATPARPPDADTLVRAALAAHQRGELDRAEGGYLGALAVRPEHPLALHYLGVVFYQRHRLDEAMPLLERAAAVAPREPEFQNNLGLALAAADRNDEAIAAYLRALALKPDHAVASNNLGLALQASNRLPEAIAAYREALRIAPDFAQAHWNLALALLAHGEFAEGWREYEWRLSIGELGKHAQVHASPRWDGNARPGLTLLVHTEQGLGDALQFSRFVTPLAQRGVRVVVVAAPPLVPLLATVPGVASTVGPDDPVPRHDAHIPMLSLPGVLGVGQRDIPSSVPYIAAEPARRAQAAAALEPYRGRLKVGLAWAGNREHANDRRRSIALAALTPLFDVPGTAWFSLQPAQDDAATASVADAGRLVRLPLRSEFAGTAALVAELDLVVTVDTSIAHLAGALGKPTWLLLPFAPDWRWQLGCADSPWYPTMRLFRQPEVGAWDAVVRDVAAALTDRLAPD